jgi:hypothetical protein
MHYLLLIYGDPAEAPPEAQSEAAMQRWFQYTQELEQAGVMKGGNALDYPQTATTVRVRGGETLLTDGPFAETKEVIVGFDILECADLDEAIAVAAAHPMAYQGRIELRPYGEL